MKTTILLYFLFLCLITSAHTYYVAPTTAIPAGNDLNAGTFEAPWASFAKAISSVIAGDTVFFRGGTYYPTAQTNISCSGTPGNLIYFLAYPGEIPIFSGRYLPTGNVRMFSCYNVSYLYFKGLKVTKVYQSAFGVYVIGFWAQLSHHITYENCITSYVDGRAYQIHDCHDISYINCDAYESADYFGSGTPGPGNGGAGFCFTDTPDFESGGNISYYGCRAWRCSDDGFQGTTNGLVTLEKCWSWNNGFLVGGGGGGFKLGWIDLDIEPLSRVVINCISAMNLKWGFHDNCYYPYMEMNGHWYNNFTYGNGWYGYNTGGAVSGNHDVYINNISFNDTVATHFAGAPGDIEDSNNSWNTPPGVTVTNDDFVSLDTAQLRWPRQADGSLPDITFGKLASTSDLIDKGVDVGIPFNGIAPDLGAWENDSQIASNMYPSVVITSPSVGSAFAAPATITISANAADADGAISKVEFFNGATKLGEKTSNPWSFTWNNVAVGTYSLTAVATDNSNASTKSSGVSITVTPVTNQSPVVSISSPTKSTSFISPATVTIDAAASDPDGAISKIEFYNGSTKLGERTTAPYSFIWKDVMDGTYSITAAATDNSNSRTVSAAVSFTVLKSGTAVNQLPVVSIASPNNKKKHKKNDNIVFEVVAFDPDGIISSVELKSGNTTLVEMTTAPYIYIWENADTGTYLITAIATDNLNATSTSSTVEMIVVPFYDANSEIINLYPNPNDGHFSIDIVSSLPYEKNNITIISLTGKTVYNEVIKEGESSREIDLSTSAAGTYVLIITSNNTIITAKKYIKE